MGWPFILDNAAIWGKLGWNIWLKWFFSLCQKWSKNQRCLKSCMPYFNYYLTLTFIFCSIILNKIFFLWRPPHPDIFWASSGLHKQTLKTNGGFVEADGAPGYEEDGGGKTVFSVCLFVQCVCYSTPCYVWENSHSLVAGYSKPRRNDGDGGKEFKRFPWSIFSWKPFRFSDWFSNFGIKMSVLNLFPVNLSGWFSFKILYST